MANPIQKMTERAAETMGAGPRSVNEFFRHLGYAGPNAASSAANRHAGPRPTPLPTAKYNAAVRQFEEHAPDMLDEFCSWQREIARGRALVPAHLLEAP